jgi:uncharacterized protein
MMVRRSFPGQLPARLWEDIVAAGAAEGRERRCAARFPDTDVLVFGHSHIPWDTTTATGLRLLNPGSPTDRRRQPRYTHMTATVDGGRLTEVQLVDSR